MHVSSSKSLNDISSRIKSRRIELGLSLKDVSEIAGISKSTLQRYETGGIRSIPLQKLGPLSSALKTSAEWICGWRDDPDDTTPSLLTPLDTAFKKFLDCLGVQITPNPTPHSRIYIYSKDGSGQITLSEYNQFRDNIISYITFSASNLSKMAATRDENRLADEQKRLLSSSDLLGHSNRENIPNGNK